ncbi:MAG: hypothetical protein QJR06_07410 [Alicyclobacillaceae bacterium]|nr:hypothetical protein [Alicyclobacillaceae bacterium]
MSAWTRQFRLECAWIWRNWFFLLLPAGFGLWFCLDLSRLGPPASEDLYAAVYGFHEVQQTLSLGVAMGLGVLLLRRDVLRPTYEWLGALPVSRGGIIAAKYAAGLLYLSQFTLVMAVLFAFFGIRRELPGDVLVQHLGFFALQDEWSYGVTLALAMFLALAIPGRVVYLIAFCGWVFGTFFLDEFVIHRFDWYFLKTFHLNQWFNNDYIRGNETWGYSLISREIALSRVFVAAFTVWLLSSATAVLMSRWPAAARRKALAVAALVMIGTAAAYVPYGLLWKDLYTTRASAGQAAGGNPERRPPAMSFPVESYDITLHREPDDVLDGAADLTFRTADLGPGQTVTFTLNRLFTVNRVVINGQPVTVERDGDHFTVARSAFGTAPGTVTMHVEYRGRVYDWVAGEGERFAAFVRGKDVYLPFTQGWYPLPGRLYLKTWYPGWIRLSSPDDEQMFPALSSAAYRVAISGFAAPVYANVEGQPGPGGSTVFSGDHLDGVSLFGGALTEVRASAGGCAVVCSPSNVLEARRFAAGVDRAKAYFRTWLNPPENRARRVVYVPVPPFDAVGDFPGTFFRLSGNSFVTGESRYHNLDDYRLVEVVHGWLFGDPYVRVAVPYDQSGVQSGVRSLTQDIRRAFLYLGLRDGLGMSADRAASLVGPMSEEVRRPIDGALARGDAERVKGVLKAFYERGLSMTAGPKPTLPVVSLQDWQKAWGVAP